MDTILMIRPALITAGLLAAASAFAQDGTDAARDPKKTEVWTPVPAVVATPPGKAPSDAIVLFDGVQIIDFAAPYEVFGTAGFSVVMLSADGGLTAQVLPVTRQAKVWAE